MSEDSLLKLKDIVTSFNGAGNKAGMSEDSLLKLKDIVTSFNGAGNKAGMSALAGTLTLALRLPVSIEPAIKPEGAIHSIRQLLSSLSFNGAGNKAGMSQELLAYEQYKASFNGAGNKAGMSPWTLFCLTYPTSSFNGAGNKAGMSFYMVLDGTVVERFQLSRQ